MYVENIIRDLNDLIFDVKAAGVKAYDNRRDADRTFTRVSEDWEDYEKAYDMTSEGLEDASQALNKAKDDFGNIEQMLLKIIEDIQMETLSAKVQAK